MNIKPNIDYQVLRYPDQDTTVYKVGENNQIRDKQKGKLYLGDITNNLPTNCIFDKNSCGCGGSEQVLRSKGCSILVVPLKMLINSKVQQHDHANLSKPKSEQIRIEAIHSGKDFTNTIARWQDGDRNIKVMVTYDSFHKILEYIKFIDTSAWNILIDEVHLLSDSYGFRDTAVDTALETAKSFENVIYMTATPVVREFIPQELEHLPIVRMEWEGEEKTAVKMLSTDRPIVMAVQIAKLFLDGKLGNCHIYLNSVADILRVYDKIKDRASDVRVVVSDTPENRLRLPEEVSVPKDLTIPKKINLYTSCVFTGVDLFDKIGKAYVVSTARSPSTILSIGTTLVQAAGRLRDTQFNKITHIVSTSCRFEAEHGSYSEYKAIINDAAKKTKDEIDAFNEFLDANPDAPITYKPSYTKFYTKRKGRFHYNDNKRRVALYDYYLLSRVYSSEEGLKNEYIDAGLDIDKYKDKYEESSSAIKMGTSQRIPFKERYFEALAVSNGTIELNPDEKEIALRIIKKASPVAVGAVEWLTEERVCELKYNKQRVEIAIRDTKNSDYTNGSDTALSLFVLSKFKISNTYKAVTVKNTLQAGYDGIGLDKKAKATDLSKDGWFEVKKRNLAVLDKNGSQKKDKVTGKPVRELHYKIIKPLGGNDKNNT